MANSHNCKKPDILPIHPVFTRKGIQQMKRFEIVSSCIGPGNHGVAQRERADGNWVRYYDASQAIIALKAALDLLPEHAADCDPNGPGAFKCFNEALRLDIARIVEA
jgi:hypothetical protein